MSSSKAKPQPLEFVTYDPGTRPTNKDPTLRSRVRSHVTRLQHRKEREKRKFAGSAGTLPPQLQHPAEPNAEHESSPATGGADSETSSLNSPVTAGPSPRSSSISGLRSSNTQTAVILPPVSSAAQLVRSGKLAANVSRQNITSDPNDQMARVLANLNLDFATVFDHYKWIVRVQSPDWDRIFMPTAPPGTGFKILTAAVAQDPAMVATAVLVAAGHILSIRDNGMSRNVARWIFELKSFVLQVVNEALRDARRAVSDVVVCAVLILAGHEGLQGSTESFHVHMRGLVQMINLRGGLSHLNDHHPWLEEYVIWQDTNVCAIMQCEPYWSRTLEHTKGLPTVRPRPRMWLLKETA